MSDKASNENLSVIQQTWTLKRDHTCLSLALSSAERLRTMCQLMKTIQIYNEKPQLRPIYTLSEMPTPETDAQRRSWMKAERRARKAENIQLNQYWRETHQLLFQIQSPCQGSQAAEHPEAGR